MYSRLFFLLNFLFLAGFVLPASAPALAAPKPAPAAPGWDQGKQGRFVMALLEDQRGDLWAATEDKGIWRYTNDPQAKPDPDAAPDGPPAKTWINYLLKDGLGDDTVYALAEDRRGRIWAGTQRNGVSVWNGQRWQNYGVLDGPLGEHVFAIATCPSNGDVWIATNLGLARYSLLKDTWRYYTRAEGLPSDQIQALAFDSTGTLYAGTQCDGLVIAHGTDYADWRIVPGPAQMPLAGVGEGLPSAQVNDVLVADNDTVYAATTCGLARSKDGGETWSFVRGADWAEKVKNQRHKPQPQMPTGALNYEELREDYVTNLGEDEKGLLYIGYRQKGYEIRRPLTDRVPLRSAREADDRFPYVGAVLPLRDGRILLANYGSGLTVAEAAPPFVPTADENKEMGFRRNWKNFELPRGPVALPAVAAPPTEAELQDMIQKVGAAKAELQPGEGYYEGDDWRTWGDWVGRYGSRYAVLCASGSPLNHYIVNDPSYKAEGSIGPGFESNSLRHWIHWEKTDNPRVLYNPLLGFRRDGEWDDHAEALSFSVEGPDVWVKVTVPAGTHRLSTYYFNKDGHDGNNRMRDYLLELKKGHATTVQEAEKLPTQAKSRVRDFWGGVYKRFVVQGPSTCWLKVGKNNSFNTTVCGVFLDKIAGPETKWEYRRDFWTRDIAYSKDGITTSPLKRPRKATKKSLGTAEAPPADAPAALWSALEAQAANPQSAAWQLPLRVLCYRAESAQGWGNLQPKVTQRQRGANLAIQEMLYRWRRQSAWWMAGDRVEFQDEMAKGFEGALARYPQNAPFPQ